MNHYRRLISLVRPHQGTLILAFFAMAMNSVLSGLPAVGMMIPFVDTILAGKPILVPHQEHVPVFFIHLIEKINRLPRWDLLNLLILWTLVLSFFRLLFEFLQSYLMNDLSYKVIRDLRNDVYSHIIDLPLSFFNRSQTGVLVSKITNDTTDIRDSVSEGLTDLLFQPLQVIVNLVALLSVKFIFNIPWFLVIVIFVLLPAIFYLVKKVTQKLRKISRFTQEQAAGIHSMLIETISGIRIVQGFGMEDYEKERFKKQSESNYKTMMAAIKRNILVSPVTEFFSYVSLSVILWFGGRLVIKSEMSSGAFIAFLIASFSMTRPIKRISRLYAINQKALAAADRIFEIIDTPNEIKEASGSKELLPIQKEINFQNISFSYGEKNILSQINFTVKTGQIVAIVGPSGAGKTTFVNLLPRFYDPKGGLISIDGVNIKDVKLKSLRDQIGIVTQETVLFNDTVSANIAYGRAKTSQEAIEKAAKIANAHNFISKLPLKYETVVGDRGVRLSGGERQRISIARAVLKNPPILILDEATSALDSESEILVQEAISNLMQGRTVLVIAHRLSTIKHAHKILVLNDGQIAESGSHDELLAKGGLYKHLYELQFRV